jgi:hypothetical protein
VREGDRVTYTGPQTDYTELQPGAAGKILVHASSTHVHLQGSSGAVYLVSLDDLAPMGRTAAADPLEDSLEVGGISTFAVREVYETDGETGVINAMATLGHLSAFGEIAEEALMLVTARIRQDPSFREVLAHLDDEEGESVLRMAAACLVRDAFHEAE